MLAPTPRLKRLKLRYQPGDADASYLFSLVTHEAEPFMPQNADKMPDVEIDLLRSWINGGALENKGSQAVKSKTKMIPETSRKNHTILLEWNHGRMVENYHK